MRRFLRENQMILWMLLGILAGCLAGVIWPEVRSGEEVVLQGATRLAFLGTLFINMMFCVVVPLVFFSIASAIAGMGSPRRAGRLMGVTVVTFLATAAVAGVLMYAVCRVFPLTAGQYEAAEGTVDQVPGAAELVVSFFTKPDFAELLSRRAILPLIVAAVLFGFGVQMAGGAATATARWMQDVTACIMKTVRIITWYAPVGFFGFFASLVASYGPQLIGDYGRTLLIYYVVSFAYMLVFFPLYARFGGGKGAARLMWSKLLRPAAMAFGSCSSVATLPTNAEVCAESGVSSEVSDIVLPLGATMHMDGSAMSAIIKVAFLFGIFGQSFGTGKAVLAIVVAVFSSVAMSGIPGGGGSGELVICTIFFPQQLAVAYPIAVALGNLVDPPATMVNAAGDYVACYVVSRFVDGKDWLQKKLRKTGAQ